MMIKNIGLQLYSLKNELKTDPVKTLEKVSKSGFKGVELFNAILTEAEIQKNLFRQFNLKPIAMHCDVLTTEGLMKSLEIADQLECENLICPYCAPGDFESEKNINEFAVKLNRVNEIIRANNKNLLYHNHDFEFRIINDECAFNLFAARLDHSICFELDLYLAAVGNANIRTITQIHADRIKMLHLKDGQIKPPLPNVAIGDGKMDYKSLLTYFPETIEWAFIEFESCNSGIFNAILKSKMFCKSLLG